MQTSRLQTLLTLLGGIFLATAVAVIATFALAPDTALVYRPFLLTAFVVTLFIGLVCITWLLRGLLRPYTQLIGEAKRAPVPHSGKSENEAAFVLETFQSVVAQLQEKQDELRRLSEQASQRADSAERFSEHIVASMPTGLIAFDAQGKATVINHPAANILRDANPSTGEHFQVIFARAPSLAALVEFCLSTGQISRREEIDMTNGSLKIKLGATVAPIERANAAEARGAMCLISDITEVSRLREEVALKRNLESLGEMSAGLAHEFKNSMAALHGYAQFLQTVGHDEQGQAAADALLQEVRNLAAMTTSFLDFARPQALQVETVSVAQMLSECVRELSPLFESRKVDCVTTSTASDGAEDPEVRADPRLLRQALLNLLRNGAEAISENDAVRRVVAQWSTERDDGRNVVAISIRDSGPGIPESDLQRIFIPFFTTKAKGHGIGLALAHRVITEHGGTLSVTNNDQGGACFTVRLPAWVEPARS